MFEWAKIHARRPYNGALRITAWLAAGVAALAGLLPAPVSAQAIAEDSAPRLIVMLTVDQMRPDYLDRFASQFTGGFARLLHSGARFMNAYQDHAITETAVGHSSLLSGRFPRSTGIVRNARGVEDPQHPLIGGGGDPASPFRFRGSELIDWLRLADPASRALSVSRKDRAAILPIGRAPQNVYWYALEAGRITTSRYYGDTLPAWIERFNARDIPRSYVGKTWNLLLPDTAYPEPDTVPAEGHGWPSMFPHVFEAGPDAMEQFKDFPWMDRYILDLALEGVNQLRIGMGDHTDLLAISLSTTDAVGHRFGPASREQHDQIVRLDRELGVFLDSLFTLVDSTRVVIALSADHAVAPMPETRDPENAAAMHVSIGPQLDALRDRLQSAGIDRRAVRLESGAIWVDSAAIVAGGLDPDSLITDFADQVRGVPGVQRVDRVRDLTPADTVGDEIARRWYHMIPPDLPVALGITLEPYYYWGNPHQATHGTPHDYDTHVPLLFYGPAIKSGRYEETVRTVDIAPTLARIAGVVPTEPLDGHVLEEVLRRR